MREISIQVDEIGNSSKRKCVDIDSMSTQKRKMLEEIQSRLPDNIVIEDETGFDFTEDEFASMLSWIKYFNLHYMKYGMEKYPDIMFPLLSKRMRFDFGLYIPEDEGKHVIYISKVGVCLDGKVRQTKSIKSFACKYYEII